MSAAAGIGSLAEGFARGLQLQSNLQDAQQRRGLMGLQMQREEAAINKEAELTDVRKQIAERVMTFNPTDPNNQEEFDRYYNEITPLMMKEATLAGANPELVRQSISNLRNSKYAERLYQGIGKIQAGDASGFDVIKPLYNTMFKDGGTLVGGAYDRESDKILLNYKDAQGQDQSMAIPRQSFVRQALGYANPHDAMKLEYRELLDNAREGRGQQFQLDVLGRRQAFDADQGNLDRASRERIAAGSNAATLTAARIGREGRNESRNEQIRLQAINDFEKDLDNGLGVSGRSSGIPLTEQERATLNQARSAGRVAFDSTYDVLGTRITGPQFMDVMDGYRSGRALIKDDPKSGLRGVEYNGVRVVVPISSGLFAPGKAPAQAPKK